jgi:hypothetical protein
MAGNCSEKACGGVTQPTHEEFRELADIQYRLAQVMRSRASIEKEYMMCFAEAEHFQHVHIHFVAKPVDLPLKFRDIPCWLL